MRRTLRKVWPSLPDGWGILGCCAFCQQGGEDALAALAALSAQCSKMGSNLNQLARHFNSGGKDTEQLRAQILEELSALTNFRLKAEETVGELYGNHQAFDLEKL